MGYDSKITGIKYMNEVIKCLQDRRSIRKFSDIPIKKDTLEEIIKCGMAAPNGQNKQTWKYIVLSDKSQIDYLEEKIIEVLDITKTDSLHGFGNPAAVIIVTDRKNNYNAVANGSCAIANMLNAAWSLQIGGCWINALRTIQDEPLIREMLGQFEIPGNHMVVGMIVLGHLQEDVLPQKPRRRMDVVHFVE